MKILKSRIFLVLVSVILATSITAYATISPNSESIIYDNTNSGITATNMQDAIDELYEKANNSGSGVAEAPTLLWTNENPTAAFAAQTINLDLSEYSSIVFELDNSSQSAYSQKSTYVIKRGTGTIYTISTVNDNYSNILNSRKVTITDTGISFGTGYHSSGTSASTSNTWTIPLKIYGLKTGVSASTSEAPTLLWENPDPTATFPAQTLSMDLSQYRIIIIYTQGRPDSNPVRYTYNYIDRTLLTSTKSFLLAVSNDTSTHTFNNRRIVIEDTGITFEEGYSGTTSGYNKSAVPVKIYGLKNNISASTSEAPTLLWTNPNPTSNFAAQTISLDLSDYESFIIGGKGYLTNVNEEFVYLSKNTANKYYAFGYENSSDKTFGGGVGGRNITISDTGITFSTGIRANSVAGTEFGVPLHIWGLKNKIIEE